MSIYLGPSDLQTLFARRIVTARECVDVVAQAFEEHGRGSVEALPRRILWASAQHKEPRARALKLSAAYMQDSKVMGASIYSTHFQPGSVNMWITVFSGESGDMLGVINSKHVSVWKTASTATVAARALARPGARRMALIGTGSYALEQLTFMAEVLPLDEVRCFSRDPDRLASFCARASTASGIPVQAANSARAAVAEADVVTTMTTSPVPVLEGAWLPEGAHCNVMGQHAPSAREVDTAAVLRSRLVVDSLEQALEEKGEILLPIQEGALDASHIAGELGAVLAGRVPGRRSAHEVTMFCSGGTAFEYMSLSRLLIERAREAGIGQQLS
ncbi:ornithine cyclodeaminase family protein [Ottowia sp. VDI28]|uniref:ornithine cyclodeaminase family protein n=1 Tax=Ottowia sp. VDI28 TaxID=3133968 RepID=UPI003C301F17